MNRILESKLTKFRDEHQIVGMGSLGTVLIVTRKAKNKGLPLDAATLLTPGGGQVSGLSGAAINRILQEHSVNRLVGTESGRTSRGTPSLAREYAKLLNDLNGQRVIDLEEIEAWWVARFLDFFNSQPFNLNYDQSKTLSGVLRNLLDQAVERQKKAPGTSYVGAVLQHLVGAKLELSMPEVRIKHNGYSVADAASARSGDFVIDEVAIHCTTAPTEPLMRKCKTNLESGVRPIVLTVGKGIGAAELLAENHGIDGRVEIMDALQFLAANLYEMSLFKATQRKITIDKLAQKYNEIVSRYETDPSLRIATD